MIENIKELVELSTEADLYPSRKEGNYTMNLVFSAALSFDNEKQTEEELTEYFKEFLCIERIFKHTIYTFEAGSGVTHYRLEFRTLIDAKKVCNEIGINLWGSGG